jgi:hypothetical protein
MNKNSSNLGGLFWVSQDPILVTWFPTKAQVDRKQVELKR